MKKIITALRNKTVNEKLKEFKEIEVIMNDIQYQEGIIETLEINKEIDYIILSELLPGNYEIKKLIEEIKKIRNEIKIIIILEKQNKELENYLFAKGNINIFYNNEIEIKEIANLIIQKKQKEDLEKEIQELKKIILNKDNYKTEEGEIIREKNINKKIDITEEEKIQIEKGIEKEYEEKLICYRIRNKIKNIFKKEKIKHSKKIIIISGTEGVGKSIFTINLAKELQREKNKIIIIDFDFLNNSIQVLLGIKNKKERDEQRQYLKIFNNIQLENLIVKVNSKIDLISKINLLLSQSQSPEIEILKIIKELKTKYDIILIDTNKMEEEKILKIVMKESDKIIFLTEPNILQIKKSKNLLEKYIDIWKIKKEKICILFNKVKSDTISFQILNEVFKEYFILGKINFIKNCNTLINQNMKEIFIEKRIKKQYKKIAKNILKNNNIKKYYLDKIQNNKEPKE